MARKKVGNVKVGMQKETRARGRNGVTKEARCGDGGSGGYVTGNGVWKVTTGMEVK